MCQTKPTSANIPQHLGSGLLCLLLVDELHQDALVLEAVTLALQVQLVVPATHKSKVMQQSLHSKVMHGTVM
jgi:hypothetical protein